MGLRYLETDIRVTADGQLVCFHDDTLDRVTSATGLVRSKALRDLRRLRINGIEPIPTFDEALDAFPQQCFTVDLKDRSAIEPPVKALRRKGVAERVCIAGAWDGDLVTSAVKCLMRSSRTAPTSRARYSSRATNGPRCLPSMRGQRTAGPSQRHQPTNGHDRPFHRLEAVASFARNACATVVGQSFGMDHTTADAGTSGLACEVCGRLPHPRKLRLTLAKLASVFPVELLLHALVIHFHTSYALTVTVLAVSTTVLVIWVVEPSAMRLLTRWLHAPAVHARERLHAAESLWRVRVTLDDQLGSMQTITPELAALRATVLDLQVHPLADGARAEIVVGAAEHLPEEDLVHAIQRGGGVDVHVWQTTALALVDGQTKALTLAARVAVTPEELPLAVAEMLDAQVVTDHLRLTQNRAHQGADDGTTLRIPSLSSGLFVFSRPDEPFTPAESARANRFAQIAEAALITQASSATHLPGVRDPVTGSIVVGQR